MISVREARAFPKNNSKEWNNKFICVEGMQFIGSNGPQPPPFNISIAVRNVHSNPTVTPFVSEPFERNNVARAVHEKLKFDAIKAKFAEVR